MEGEIATKIRVNDGVMSSSGRVSRVYGLHTSVETQDKIVEVKAQSQSVGSRNLLKEPIETELTARLFGIFSESPDVACIDKSCPVEFPK